MLEIYGNNLNLADLIKVARIYEKVSLKKSILPLIEKSRKLVEEKTKGITSIYGLNTGFGEFAQVKISHEDILKLQENLILSHSCGVGEPLNEEIVRAAMLLRANTLAKGFSGVRIELIDKLIELLNQNVIPYIPEKGSLGASGDLVPLAHMSMLLIGKGKGYYNGRLLEGKECLNAAGIEPLELKEKEGLSLINGTPIMTAIAAINCYDAEILLKAATIACAMSIEALHGTDRFLYDKIHIARNIKGQMVCANNIRNLIKKSEIIVSHRDCPKVQDAYSLRCSPQVIGVFHEVLKFCIGIVVKEMNSACDNPLIFDDKILSCGNFHGEPIAQAMDFFAISISEVGNISERRIFRYQDSKLSGLPACLIENSGLNNGFMITQYTAASLVSENKVLCHPASVDSIPSAADQEDHVSMGTIAAVKAIKVLKNVKHIVSIELLNAAQALDFRKPSLPGKGTKMAVDFIRKELCIPFIQCDMSMAGFIDKTYNNIENLVNYVEDKIPLKI